LYNQILFIYLWLNFKMMKFLIQKVNGKITHDFSFTLLKAIEFQNWLQHKENIKVKYFNTIYNKEKNEFATIEFKSIHKDYVPIGSVEFVIAFIQCFYDRTPMPINVPKELFDNYYTHRHIFNGNHMDLEDRKGKWFVKSREKIKGYAEIIDLDKGFPEIPASHYQISQYITIDSEWRAFVYKKKLVGLQNYCGDFTMFPRVDNIKAMINKYQSAPIAYTLDVGISNDHAYSDHIGTVIIEAHDFFSCGLYGFSDLAILPHMFHKWFYNYVNYQYNITPHE
jgi:hypothetical protein